MQKMNKNIINKGEFNLPQISNFVELKQFLFIEESGQKFLLIKLFNDRKERVTEVALEIAQKDSGGIVLDTFSMDFAIVSGNPKSTFVLNSKIPLRDNCADFAVKILSASFGNYKYTATDGEIVLSYQNSDKKNTYKQNKGFVSGQTSRVKNNSVSVNRFKIPIALFILMAVLLTLSTVFTFLITKSFVANANSFLHGGVEYAFEGGDKSENSNIYVVKSKKTASEVIIPEEIDGHKVKYISGNAFENDSKIKKVTISGEIIINPSAFINCHNLSVVNLGKTKEIGSSAFYNCSSLKELTALNLSRIGSNAFKNCASLETVLISNENSVLQLGHNVFDNCLSLTNVKIDQFIDYMANSGIYNKIDFFTKCYNIESLYLKNFNYSFTFNNIYYPENNEKRITQLFGTLNNNENFNSKLKNLTIEYCDEITEYFCYNLPIESLSITYLKNSNVGEYAFYGCNNLKTLSVPTAFTRVGSYAFYKSKISQFNSTSLTEIGEYAFSGCERLTSFDVPVSVTSIGLGAFQNCSSLQEISLPFLGGSREDNNKFNFVFGYYGSYIVPKSLKKVTVKEVTEIPSNAFSGCKFIKEIVIESNYTKIGDLAFESCYSLNNFVIPLSVSQIGENAFNNCYKLFELFNLSTLNIQPKSADNGKAGFYALKVYESMAEERIAKFSTDGYEFARNQEGNWLLINCADTKSALNLPDKPTYNNYVIDTYEVVGNMIAENYSILSINVTDCVSKIGEFAFNNCYELKSVTISQGVEQIGLGALSNCNALNQITLPFVGGSASSNQFLAYIFGANSFFNANYIPFSLKSVYLNKGTIIPDNAFYGCEFIENIKLPGELVSIGNNAFLGCSQLRSIEFPSTVKTIGASAFEMCYTLQKVTLSGIIDIKQDAFADCTSLFSIFNLGGMTLKIGSTEYGGIALYAKNIYTSLDGDQS